MHLQLYYPEMCELHYPAFWPQEVVDSAFVKLHHSFKYFLTVNLLHVESNYFGIARLELRLSDC